MSVKQNVCLTGFSDLYLLEMLKHPFVCYCTQHHLKSRDRDQGIAGNKKENIVKLSFQKKPRK